MPLHVLKTFVVTGANKAVELEVRRGLSDHHCLRVNFSLLRRAGAGDEVWAGAVSKLLDPVVPDFPRLQWVRRMLVRPGHQVLAGVTDPDAIKEFASEYAGLQILPLRPEDPASLEHWADAVASSTQHVDVSEASGQLPQMLACRGPSHRFSRAAPPNPFPLLDHARPTCHHVQMFIENAGMATSAADIRVTTSPVNSELLGVPMSAMPVMQALQSRHLVGGYGGQTMLATVSQAGECRGAVGN